jgi:hypothetical protein
VSRLLSTTLLLVFSFPLIAPLFALGGAASLRLPACCRRNGAHHCMMQADLAGDGADGRVHVQAFRPSCPMFPKAIARVHHDPLSLDAAASFYAGVASHPAQFRHVEAWARVALAGTSAVLLRFVSPELFSAFSMKKL